MNERLSKGASRRISRLKPTARQAGSEEEAWQATEKIIIMQVGDYPQGYNGVHSLIRDFHRVRWQIMTEGLDPISTTREFQSKQEVKRLECAGPILRIISQTLSAIR